MRKNLKPIDTASSGGDVENNSSVNNNHHHQQQHQNTSTSPTYFNDRGQMTRSESQSLLTISATQSGEIVSTNFNSMPFTEKPAWFVYLFILFLVYWALYFVFMFYGKTVSAVDGKWLCFGHHFYNIIGIL
jgi:hypothetical protein